MTRRNNDYLQERIVIPYDHAQVTADTTVRLLKARRKFVVDQIRYINPTGLAVDVTNFADIQVKNGATVLASWSTETGEEGAFVADTYVDFALSAVDGALTLATDDILTLFIEEGGAVTLPPGRIQIEGRYI